MKDLEVGYKRTWKPSQTGFLDTLNTEPSEPPPYQLINIQLPPEVSEHEINLCNDSDNSEGFKEPTGKGGRLIICHARLESFGFVKNSKLVFRCTSSVSEDYHFQMNLEIFKEWFIQMLSNLEEPCVVVMDNASYHSVQINNYPKKLRERIKLIIPHEKKYELDEIALSMDHEVKGKVAEQNTSFKMSYVEQLVHNALDSITTDDWRTCVLHCNKLQGDDFIKEGLRDEILETIIMTINHDDSSESEDEDDN
ncbi:DDE 3 domain-containing protein [Aphis craccivora]|uniref:DDE 3 domain-containing protein n=1 Tax=Aphis craccivora TaxID=307492 RepID=A0A6G0XYK9_APHCR|nr:DDE 3 domain-containing protein [Aphis craccivora]